MLVDVNSVRYRVDSAMGGRFVRVSKAEDVMPCKPNGVPPVLTANWDEDAWSRFIVGGRRAAARESDEWHARHPWLDWFVMADRAKIKELEVVTGLNLRPVGR